MFSSHLFLGHSSAKDRGEAPNYIPIQENPRVKIEKEEKCSTWEWWGGMQDKSQVKRSCSNMDMIAIRSSNMLLGRRSVCVNIASCRPSVTGTITPMQNAPPPLFTWQIDPEHPDCVQQYSCPITITSAMYMSLPLATLQSTSDSCTHPYSLAA